MTRTACQTVQTRNRITRAARPFEKVPCVLYPDKAANGKPVKNAACLSCTPTLIKKVYHRGTLFNSSQLFYNSFFKKKRTVNAVPVFLSFIPSLDKEIRRCPEHSRRAGYELHGRRPLHSKNMRHRRPRHSHPPRKFSRRHSVLAHKQAHAVGKPVYKIHQTVSDFFCLSVRSTVI